MRKSSIAAGVFVLLAIGLVLFSVKPDSADRILEADVQSITVRIDDPDNDRFVRIVAAPEDHKRLLALVQKGAPEPNALKWQGLAKMDIVLADGDKVLVNIYRPNEGPAAWRIGNTYYRGSITAEMDRVISDCVKRGAPVGR